MARSPSAGTTNRCSRLHPGGRNGSVEPISSPHPSILPVPLTSASPRRTSSGRSRAPATAPSPRRRSAPFCMRPLRLRLAQRPDGHLARGAGRPPRDVRARRSAEVMANLRREAQRRRPESGRQRPCDQRTHRARSHGPSEGWLLRLRQGAARRRNGRASGGRSTARWPTATHRGSSADGRRV